MEGLIDLMKNEINTRQEGFIGDYSQNTAIVIGLGGIGSWVAIDLALLGVGTIFLYDDDTIELSNLNRTLFKIADVGRSKVQVVEELIGERRPDIIVIPVNKKFDVSLLEGEFSENPQRLKIFDCTDNTKLKDSIAKLREDYRSPVSSLGDYYKLGYDGFDATMSFNDFGSGLWGEDSSYTVTPSFFGTPQVISALAVMNMYIGDQVGKKTRTFSVHRILFDMEEIHSVRENLQEKRRECAELRRKYRELQKEFNPKKYCLPEDIFVDLGAGPYRVICRKHTGNHTILTEPPSNNLGSCWTLDGHLMDSVADEIELSDGSLVGYGWWCQLPITIYNKAGEKIGTLNPTESKILEEGFVPYESDK